MASTSMTLGPHWEKFIADQVASGRYGSASDVVRAALRELEDRSNQIAALRTELRPGLEQSEGGKFVDGFRMQEVIDGATARGKASS